MADLKIPEEEKACAEKRKLEVPNPACKTSDEKNVTEDTADSNKKQKLEIFDEENGKSENISSSVVEEDDEDDDEEEDYKEEEDEDEDVAAPVDRKGKGIMIDDKGKGKMAVYDDSDDEDEDDDDDSSDDSDSDCSDGFDDDSDVEENPLAALDLDNILPSRTRQRRAQPGVRISDDRDNNSDA